MANHDNNPERSHISAQLQSEFEHGDRLISDDDDEWNPDLESQPCEDESSAGAAGPSGNPNDDNGDDLGAPDLDADNLGAPDLDDDDLDAPDIDHGATQRQSEKPKNQSKATRKSEKRKGREHGVYSRQLILPGENRAELERLKRGVINDFDPEGETQKRCARIVTSSLWTLDRIERFARRELLLAQVSPAEEEARLVQDLIPRLLRARNETVAKACVNMLRQPYQSYIEREFPRAKYGDFEKWLDALKTSALPTILDIISNAMLLEQRSLAVQTRRAERLRTKLEQILALQERGEARALKAIKGMTELKFWKASAMPRQPDRT
jgi:hypothetical protein